MNHTIKLRFTTLLILSLGTLISCDRKENNLSRNLLVEQSKKMTILFGGQLSTNVFDINKENYLKKKQTSVEYESLLKLYNEFENFKLRMKDASRLEMIKIIIAENEKFKNDVAFKMKYFRFQPVDTQKLKQLDDESFKYYTESKIAEFYAKSSANICFIHYRQNH